MNTGIIFKEINEAQGPHHSPVPGSKQSWRKSSYNTYIAYKTYIIHVLRKRISIKLRREKN